MDRHNRQVGLLVERVNNGESPETIALQEGIKLRSLYQRFRRLGYSWDDCLGKYTKQLNTEYQGRGPQFLPERAVQVIIQCRGVKADRKTAAIRLGFRSLEEMDLYMKQFEFEWCRKEHTYKAMD